MRYILKYQVKSKYFNFIREYTKEFDKKLDALKFTINSNIIAWKLYKKESEYNFKKKKESDNNE